MGLINNLSKKIENAVIMSEDNDVFTINEYIDTGHIGLNCQISAKPYGGIPCGKIIQFAGEQSTGKTYLSHVIIRNAQKQGYEVILFDTEFAQVKEDLESKGIDLSKLLVIPISSLEEFRTTVVNILDDIGKNDKVMMVLDSLGNLYTEKEYKDAKTGSDKTDMTRAKILKSVFRLISVKVGLKKVPFILLNHVYADQSSFIKRNIVSGGGGSLYSSSAIIELTKAQDKDSKGKNIGVILTSKATKSRLAKEKTKVKIGILFDKGIARYSGLLEFAIDGGFIKDLGRKRYEYKGEKLSSKDLTKDFWENLLKNEGFAEYLEKEFKYNNLNADDIIENEEIEDMEVENETTN